MLIKFLLNVIFQKEVITLKVTKKMKDAKLILLKKLYIKYK